MAKTPSKKPAKATTKRSREEEEPSGETKRQKSVRVTAKGDADAKNVVGPFEPVLFVWSSVARDLPITP